MTIVWSILIAAMGSLTSRNRQTGIVLGLMVFSHWVLDFVVHPPNLPLLFSGSPLAGLGLWSSVPDLIISGILEFTLLAGGIAICLATRKRTTLKAAH
jgi:hypothetical protein